MCDTVLKMHLNGADIFESNPAREIGNFKRKSKSKKASQ